MEILRGGRLGEQRRTVVPFCSGILVESSAGSLTQYRLTERSTGSLSAVEVSIHILHLGRMLCVYLTEDFPDAVVDHKVCDGITLRRIPVYEDNVVSLEISYHARSRIDCQ